MSLIQQRLDAKIAQVQPRSATDLLIDFLTPLMIFVMVASVMLFLLDVRWVYTEVHDRNLRFVALAFILGVVALNRLIAQDGSQESQLYFVALAGAIGLYTVATTNMYGVGAFAGGTESAWINLGINMSVVCFIWWLTNRLTHECCVDDNPAAGEIGILTGTADRFRKALRQGEAPANKPKESLFALRKPKPYIEQETYVAVDPLDWKPEEPKAPQHYEDSEAAKRAPKRHPGISIFYFSVPVMFAFSVGLRVTQHGGDLMLRMGEFYLGVYCVAALSLLMLSSLAGLREYFRARGTRIPGGIGPFWVGLGVVMIAMVLVGALSLPMPDMPRPAIIESHEYDPWDRGRSTFEPLEVTATAAERIEQARFIEYLSRGVLVCFALFIGYGALKGVGATAYALAREHKRLPRPVTQAMKRLDRALQRVTNLPKLPTLQPRQRRISRQIATCTQHRNPMAGGAGTYTPNDAVAKSYDALCALAYDLGVPRRPDQTPYEFIDHFPRELRNLKDEAIDLTNMLVASEYAGRAFNEKDLDTLRKFWIQYERVRNRVVK